MPPTLRALPLSALDLGVAALLYRLASPPLGLLLGAVGIALLAVVCLEWSRSAADHLGSRPVE